jgi:hypothetical protein
MDDVPKGRPLAIDATAQSASPTEPGFIARPEGAPVYYGFVVLDDVTVDGFTLGKITDFEAEPCDEGDAFVIAPDGGRAGLVWEVYDPPYFREIMPVETGRWGLCEAECSTGRLETGEGYLGRVPNDDDFGAVKAVCDPCLTQMEIGESR